MAHAWGYTKENGPDKWTDVAPASKGLHQSPIDIRPSDVLYDSSLSSKPLCIHYESTKAKVLLNNGHSVQMVFNGEGSLLQGGPYPHKYNVEQFHFHWGKTSAVGAEHLVNGRSHAAELHIVHWNAELFSSFSEAAKSANGLAVLCVFLQPGSEHDGLAKIVQLLPNVRHAGSQIDVSDGFDPSCLLPADRNNYWTYSGSLTTPPCYESVRFLIFKEPIEVSEQQLQAFRQLVSHCDGEAAHHDEFHGHIVNNFRPTLPLRDRKVLATFE